MPCALYHVDAFTDQPFAGNPAAVCLLTAEHDDTWLQHVAAELNLPETAFVQPIPGGFALRWFSPAAEVELCGHATLAAAHVLWQQQLVGPEKHIAFRTTHHGLLLCEREAHTGLIAMDFPTDPPKTAPPPAGLIDALGVTPAHVLKSQYDWIVELDDEHALRAANPDFVALAGFDMRGAALTARAASSDLDYVCRFFAPQLRIDEDPVTGSLQTALGPYWRRKLGKDVLDVEQCSARGGRLRVAMRDPGDRIALAGHAVTISVGQLLVN